MVEKALAIGCTPVDIISADLHRVHPHRCKGVPRWEEGKRVSDRTGPDATYTVPHKGDGLLA